MKWCRGENPAGSGREANADWEGWIQPWEGCFQLPGAGGGRDRDGGRWLRCVSVNPGPGLELSSGEALPVAPHRGSFSSPDPGDVS